MISSQFALSTFVRGEHFGDAIAQVSQKISLKGAIEVHISHRSGA
jgi:hypothetical protein